MSSRSLASPNRRMTDLESRLAALAAAGETVTYGALARELDCRVAQLTDALERLMAEDTAAGRPLRAAVMRGRMTGDLPARGFFDAAAALGHDVSDPAGFVARHRAALRRA